MGAGAAIIGSSVISAGAGALSSGSAADTQSSSADTASATQMAMFNKTQQNLDPFLQYGGDAYVRAAQTARSNPFSYGSFNFSPDMATLSQTPGYQFSLQQGNIAAQNSAASRGLGSSGQAIVGAEQYSQGLASQTYQQQFNNALSGYQTNYNNAFNTYQNNLQNEMAIGNTGENAAAGLGNNAQQIGTSIGNNIVGAGNAQAASQIAGGNALGGIGSGLSQAAMFNNLNGGIYGNTANAGTTSAIDQLTNNSAFF